MYRTNHCGALRVSDAGSSVTLSGWVQRIRKLGGLTFVDLRDRYGITQLFFDKDKAPDLYLSSEQLGREFVISVEGTVVERSSKNPELPTGEIEVCVSKLTILSKSATPPFTIEENTDGGEELRSRYRYLDLRRSCVQKGIILRSRMAQAVRKYLTEKDFLEIETPFLIKSTPEGARDFVVPSRMSQGKFYALPQSPQVFKQLLMIAGYDKYFQLTKCFRDEDFRADRQPEFTQIDCEMSFVTKDDVIETFEGLAKFLFKEIKGLDFSEDFPQMSYDEAMSTYGSDRPDLRFGMPIVSLKEVVSGKGFKVFDETEFVGGICVPGLADYSRKQTDALIKWVQRPQIGAKGLVFAKYNADGTFKSSVDKFYTSDDLKQWAEALQAAPGDLLLLMSGTKKDTLEALGTLRLEMGDRLNLRKESDYAPVWIIDFPLFEKDEETGELHAVHHPFTSPKLSEIELLEAQPEAVKAEAYDLVINGMEIGGGSIRIHDTQLQAQIFKRLGFSEEEAREQFGFLLDAFQYGAPPHGGIAFGFDRWVALFNGSESIRDVIAFPKNNAGRDVMIDAPASLDEQQLDDLYLSVKNSKE